MKKKVLSFILVLMLGVFVFAGCASDASDQDTATPDETETPDVTAGASMAVDNDSFVKAISAEGSWIVLTEQDLTFVEDLIVEGVYIHTGHDGSNATGRSLAFATANPDYSVDQRFTVTTPNFVINSPETFVEYGIIAGDVYVQAPGFNTYNARIEGNLYFATQALMDAYVQDDLTQISGSIEVKSYTK